MCCDYISIYFLFTLVFIILLLGSKIQTIVYRGRMVLLKGVMTNQLTEKPDCTIINGLSTKAMHQIKLVSFFTSFFLAFCPFVVRFDFFFSFFSHLFSFELYFRDTYTLMMYQEKCA